MSKDELKNRVVKKCEMNFGFAPTKSSIVLLEASGDGNYIMFRVYNKKYNAHSEYKINGIHIEQTRACTGATPRDFEYRVV